MNEADKKLIDEARKRARDKANAKADPELEKIKAQAGELQTVFDSLKLTDKATYNTLVEAVNAAKANNESISGVITRLSALGQTGKNLAASITSVAGTGPIGILTKALRLG